MKKPLFKSEILEKIRNADFQEDLGTAYKMAVLLTTLKRSVQKLKKQVVSSYRTSYDDIDMSVKEMQRIAKQGG
jgi:hypothetical protein